MRKGGDRRSFMALAAGLSAAAAGATGAMAREGAAMQLFVFLYSKGPAWKAGVPMEKQGLGGHAAYMQRLMDDGRLFAGGRFMNSDGGMAIVTAANLDEARVMLAVDPALTGGVFVGDVQHWAPRLRTDAPLPGRKPA